MATPAPEGYAATPSRDQCTQQMFAFSSHVADGELGIFIEKIPIIADKRLSKLIYVGRILGILDECLILACILDGQQYPFLYPKEDKDQLISFYQNQLKLDAGTFSDHLMMIKVFKILENFDDDEMEMTRSEWIDEHGINSVVFGLAASKKVRLVRLMQAEDVYFNVRTNLCPNSVNLLVKSAVAAAFLPVAFYSTFGVGNGNPVLFKMTNVANGRRVKTFYDLTRTLTYKRVPFRSWTEEIYERSRPMSLLHLDNHYEIEQNVMGFLNSKRATPESIDLVIQEQKLNVVLPNRGPRINNFMESIYILHRWQQLGEGNVPIPTMDHGYYGQETLEGYAYGPHNPLELKFKSLVHRPVSEKVRVDGSSVCCAVFDSNYHHDRAKNKSRKFLLIGSQLLIQHPDILITKCNTLYNEGEGQLEVTLLLFGPKIQLYSNRPTTHCEMLLDFGQLFMRRRLDGQLPPPSAYMDLPINLKGFCVGSGKPSDAEWGLQVPCQFELSYSDFKMIYKIRDRINNFNGLSRVKIQELHGDIIGLLAKNRTRIQRPIARDNLIIPPNNSSNCSSIMDFTPVFQ